MGERNKLPRSAGLKSRRDIEHLFAEGRRCKRGSLVCIWQPAGRFEYGVFVSRDLGTAVQRNRVKRRLREAIRLCRNRLKHPVRYGLMATRACLEADFEQIHAEVEATIDRINRTLD